MSVPGCYCGSGGLRARLGCTLDGSPGIFGVYRLGAVLPCVLCVLRTSVMAQRGWLGD
jgi:hypothetical protein